MPQLCLYLQLHQPVRLAPIEVDQVGTCLDYFVEPGVDQNRQVFLKVADHSYLPMLELLLNLLKAEPKFCVTLSFSGIWFEQAAAYVPRVVALIHQAVETGRCELLCETYYHSLASLYSPAEFAAQIQQHFALLNKEFGCTPQVFRNTELVYSNDIGAQVTRLGFRGILTEGVERCLHGRPRTQLYRSVGEEALPILLKHAQLSDDVAFRFSDKSWNWFPLTVERYSDWVAVYGEGELVNLFMDFETFGEHQWRDTGIFQFFADFVHRFSADSWNSWKTPSQLVSALTVRTRSSLPMYDVPRPISWADVDRDLTAWVGNELQRDSLKQLYGLESAILKTNDAKLINDWRLLQTSDHFYYMCTKWSADGDVHAYFSPYRDPYEAYRRYSIALADVRHRAGELNNEVSTVVSTPASRSTINESCD